MIDRYILKPAIREATGLSDATLWREQRAGRFPPFEQISARRVGLRESVLREWMDGRRNWQRAAA